MNDLYTKDLTANGEEILESDLTLDALEDVAEHAALSRLGLHVMLAGGTNHLIFCIKFDQAICP